MKLADLYQQIESFIERNDLKDQTISIKEQSGIGNIKQVVQDLERLKENSQQLRIGIVGRVKAGKSSLLNAILFNGDDTLPKAATPMTAALTMIQYSEEIKAELEFFDQQDLEQIQKEHDKYQEELEKRTREIIERNLKRSQRRSNSSPLQTSKESNVSSSQEMIERSRRMAQAEMQNSPYAASYDQHQRIITTGLKYQDLESLKHISANSIKDLINGKLQDFVGANGKYMPFTKSVTLKIPENNLQDLEIIDTPGINDPVQSRSKRTEEMLSTCDVIFLISPAGQFLSNEDIQLMQRIATREGIQEIYIISSQVDNQLYGNEGENIYDPREIINNISQALTRHAYQVLEKKANDATSQIGGHGIANVYQKALENNVICTSGIAYSLWKRFNDQENWDNSLKHTWQNLKERFPDYFNDQQTALLTLQSLANIDEVHSIIQNVKARKLDIFSTRIKKLESDKYQAINNYLHELQQYIFREINDLSQSDIKTLKEQQFHLRNQADETEDNIKESYEELISNLNIELRKQLITILEKTIQVFQVGSENARGSQEESYKQSTGKSWWEFWKDEYEVRYRTVKTVNASEIRRSIEYTRSYVEKNLNLAAIEYQDLWKKKLKRAIFSAMRGKDIGDGTKANDEFFNPHQTQKVINTVVSYIKSPEFRFLDNLPNKINKSGTLRDNEGEEFFEAAKDYVQDFERMVLNEVNDYIQDLIENLQDIDIAESLIKMLEKEIMQRIEEIKSKEASLQRYQRMQDELKSLQGKAHG